LSGSRRPDSAGEAHHDFWTSDAVDITAQVAQILGLVTAIVLVHVGVVPFWSAGRAAADVQASLVMWGRLGTGVPADLTDLVGFDGGAAHSLALKADGTVVAWGDNGYGQTDVPSDLSNVVQVDAGAWFSAALKADGTVVVWGDNNSGEREVPPGLSGVKAITAGGDHVIALRQDGTLVGWGGDYWGQATPPAGLHGVVAIAAGIAGHTLALKSDGTVFAWGNNIWGPGQTDVPTGLTGVKAVAAGVGHSLALKEDGSVVAWGANWAGQSDVPAVLSGVTAIAAGGGHSLALKEDGTLVPWGYNAFGQTEIPAGLTNVTAIAAGGWHNLALGELRTLPPPRNPPDLHFEAEFTEVATSADGAVVNYDVSATDSQDPNPSLECDRPSGSQFPLGATWVSCTATNDAAMSTTGAFQVIVTYSWSGVLEPIKSDSNSVFRLGSVIPVKFALTGASAGFTELSANFTTTLLTDNGSAAAGSPPSSAREFRFDPKKRQYVFNWSTAGLAAGTYQLDFNFGDGAQRYVQLSLRR
jgi:hypothetical protein